MVAATATVRSLSVWMMFSPAAGPSKKRTPQGHADVDVNGPVVWGRWQRRTLIRLARLSRPQADALEAQRGQVQQPVSIGPTQRIQQAELGRGRLGVRIADLESIDRGLDLRPQTADAALSLLLVLPRIIEGRKRAALEAGPVGTHVGSGLAVYLVIQRGVQVLQRITEQQAQRLWRPLEYAKADLAAHAGVGDSVAVQVCPDLTIELVDQLRGTEPFRRRRRGGSVGHSVHQQSRIAAWTRRDVNGDRKASSRMRSTSAGLAAALTLTLPLEAQLWRSPTVTMDAFRNTTKLRCLMNSWSPGASSQALSVTWGPSEVTLTITRSSGSG